MHRHGLLIGLISSGLLLVGGCAEPISSAPAGGPPADSRPAPDTVGPGVGATTDGASGETPAGTHESPNNGAPADASAPTAIQLEVVDKEGYEAVLKKHRGKVVLVDMWATWCLPCRKSFPHTVEWANEFGDDLAVVAVSFDEPDDEEAVAEAVDFLASQKVAFDTLISKFGGSDATSYELFEIDSGALPHYKIYGREGQLVKKFENFPDEAPEPEDIEAALREALGVEAEANAAE